MIIINHSEPSSIIVNHHYSSFLSNDHSEIIIDHQHPSTTLHNLISIINHPLSFAAWPPLCQCCRALSHRGTLLWWSSHTRAEASGRSAARGQGHSEAPENAPMRRRWELPNMGTVAQLWSNCGSTVIKDCESVNFKQLQLALNHEGCWASRERCEFYRGETHSLARQKYGENHGCFGWSIYGQPLIPRSRRSAPTIHRMKKITPIEQPKGWYPLILSGYPCYHCDEPLFVAAPCAVHSSDPAFIECIMFKEPFAASLTKKQRSTGKANLLRFFAVNHYALTVIDQSNYHSSIVVWPKKRHTVHDNQSC